MYNELKKFEINSLTSPRRLNTKKRLSMCKALINQIDKVIIIPNGYDCDFLYNFMEADPYVTVTTCFLKIVNNIDTKNQHLKKINIAGNYLEKHLWLK